MKQHQMDLGAEDRKHQVDDFGPDGLDGLPVISGEPPQEKSPQRKRQEGRSTSAARSDSSTGIVRVRKAPSSGFQAFRYGTGEYLGTYPTQSITTAVRHGADIVDGVFKKGDKEPDWEAMRTSEIVELHHEVDQLKFEVGALKAENTRLMARIAEDAPAAEMRVCHEIAERARRGINDIENLSKAVARVVDAQIQEGGDEYSILCLVAASNRLTEAADLLKELEQKEGLDARV